MKKIFILIIVILSSLSIFNISAEEQYSYIAPSLWNMPNPDTGELKHYIVLKNSNTGLLGVVRLNGDSTTSLTYDREQKRFKNGTMAFSTWDNDSQSWTGYVAGGSGYNLSISNFDDGENWEIVATNKVLMSSEGDVYMYDDLDYFEKLSYNVRFLILSPRDGFQQQQLNMMVVSVYVENLPYDGDMANVTMGLHGYRDDRERVGRLTQYKLNGDGTVTFHYTFEGQVPWNKWTFLTASVKDYLGHTWTDTISVICYDDFLDEDNDGFDDRTNFDRWDGTKDYIPGQSSQFPSGSMNPADYFTYFGEQFSIIISSIGNFFNSAQNFGTNFLAFFKKVFNFLPSEFSMLLVLGFAVIIILRLFGR